MSRIKKLLSFITNLLFPHTCISCGAFTNYNYNTGLCVKCLNENKEFHLQKYPALKLLIQKSYFDSLNARFVYNEQIAKSILNFKFNDTPEYGKSLSKLIKPKTNHIENIDKCIIVPVPVHTKRLLTRKYNQASILAKFLAKELHIKYSNNALKRIIHTPHQTGQGASIRKKQLKDAFIANSKFIKNKDVILIDDVFTTGSTVNICAKELKEKGARSVHVLTIAYTKL